MKESKTQEFKSHYEFSKRLDKTINGVPVGFSGKSSDTNKGCWDCDNCENCTDCDNCEGLNGYSYRHNCFSIKNK